MKREEIQEVICGILMVDGPDGHIDGNGVITDFVLALLEGRGEAWAEAYAAEHPDAW